MTVVSLTFIMNATAWKDSIKILEKLMSYLFCIHLKIKLFLNEEYLFEEMKNRGLSDCTFAQ